MYEWKLFGSKWCWAHPGQCSQPRPEPVRRTVAPVATIRTSITAFSSVSLRSACEENATPRRRASGCALASIARTVALGKCGPRPFGHAPDPRQEQARRGELRLERHALLA